MEGQIKRELQIMIQEGVTDAYLMPEAAGYRLSTLIQGKLALRYHFSKHSGQRIMAYLKYRSNLDISEHRRPQSGALEWEMDPGQKINLRISTVGDYRGQESMVVRFIYPPKADFQVLVPSHWEGLQVLAQQTGVMLFAGPMGSGKMTTMYRLAEQFIDQKTIMTIEDPVEISHERFLQTQVNPVAGMDYQTLIKTSLRHRPQILIIGEIRDPQTAQMVIQAGLSGQLVMATIHARSAQGVLSRLRQLGVDQYYLHQALLAVSYQRLIPLHDQSWALHFDQLSGDDLTQSIGHEESGVAQSWRFELARACEEGRITDETYQQFKAG